MIFRLLKIMRSVMSHSAVRQSRTKALLRYVSWQMASRLPIEEFTFKWVDEALLKMKKSEAMVTHNFYTGLYEYEDFIFFMKYSSEKEILFDIGANAGVYSVLSSKVLNFDVVSFEPVRSTFERLIENLQINAVSNEVISKNIGLGINKGTLQFTNSFDATNHVVIGSVEDTETEAVLVSTLDDEVKELGIIPSIIKIDVEGFELNVFKGGLETLKSEKLKVILVELNDSGQKFGFEDEEVSKLLVANGFTACDFDVAANRLMKIPSFKSTRQNTIFVRDITEVNLRIASNKRRFFSHILQKMF